MDVVVGAVFAVEDEVAVADGGGCSLAGGVAEAMAGVGGVSPDAVVSVEALVADVVVVEPLSDWAVVDVDELVAGVSAVALVSLVSVAVPAADTVVVEDDCSTVSATADGASAAGFTGSGAGAL